MRPSSHLTPTSAFSSAELAAVSPNLPLLQQVSSSPVNNTVTTVNKKNKARQGKARQGKARQGKARQGKARQGKARVKQSENNSKGQKQ